MSKTQEELIEDVANKAIAVGAGRERLRILNAIMADPDKYATPEAFIDLVTGTNNV